MNLTPKDQSKVAKLLALALDARGSKKEADAAALKAIRICREANLSVAELSAICGGPVKEAAAEPLPFGAFDDRVNCAAADAVAGIIDELLSPFTSRRRRPTW